MGNFDELRDILTVLFTQRFAIKPYFVRGLMGNGRGQVRDPANPDMVYARPSRSAAEAFSVFNKMVPDVDGLPILIGELPWQPGLTQVVGIDWQAYPYGDWSGYAGVAPHGPTHEWADSQVGADAFTVYGRQLGPLRTYSGGSGSMTVYLAPYEYDRWGSSASWPGLPGLDLSPARPATGTARLMLTYLDLANNVPGVVTGTLDVYSDAVELPRPWVPTGTWEPSAWVRLYGGQSTISEVNDIWDARILFGRLSSPTGPAGGDLTGTYPDPIVHAWLGRALDPMPPNNGEAYVWTGSVWRPTNITTQDELGIHTGDPAAHHDPITLHPGLDNNLLSLSGQQLSLDQQAPNLFFASPPTGTSSDTPTFREITPMDLPLGDQPLSNSDCLLYLDFQRWEQPAGLTGANRRNAIIGSHGEQCWIGAAADDCDDRGAVHFVPGRWRRQRALKIEPAALNYCINPLMRDDNASTVADNWYVWDNFGSGGSPTTTILDHPDKRKGWLQQFQYTGAVGDVGDFGMVYISTTAFAPGDYCTVSVDCKVPVAVGCAVQLAIGVFDAGGTWFTTYGLNIPVSPRLTRYSLTSPTLPALTDRLIVYVSVSGVDNGDVVDCYFGAVNIEKTAFPTSFIWGGGGEGYYWTGVPHASTSGRRASYVLLSDYVGLISGNNTVTYHVVVKAPYDANATWPGGFYNFIFDARGASEANRIILNYESTDDRFCVYLNGAWYFGSVRTFTAGDWFHLDLAVDYTSDVYRLYVNGELDITVTTALTSPTLTAWVLGAQYSGEACWGSWEFAEFAVVDRVLTPQEIGNQYASGLPLLDPGAMDLHQRATVPGVSAGYWQLTYATLNETLLAGWTESGHPRITFAGAWITGNVFFEGILYHPESGKTVQVRLEWYDVATAAWRVVPGSAISSGIGAIDRFRSGSLTIPLQEVEYRVTIDGNGVSMSGYCYKAAIVVCPTGEEDL